MRHEVPIKDIAEADARSSCLAALALSAFRLVAAPCTDCCALGGTLFAIVDDELHALLLGLREEREIFHDSAENGTRLRKHMELWKCCTLALALLLHGSIFSQRALASDPVLDLSVEENWDSTSRRDPPVLSLWPPRSLIIVGAAAAVAASVTATAWGQAADRLSKCGSHRNCINADDLSDQRRIYKISTFALAGAALTTLSLGAVWLVQAKRKNRALVVSGLASGGPGVAVLVSY